MITTIRTIRVVNTSLPHIIPFFFFPGENFKNELSETFKYTTQFKCTTQYINYSHHIIHHILRTIQYLTVVYIDYGKVV